MSYLVTYGKIVDDKSDGVYLAGVYFGGIASNIEDADLIAKGCIQHVRGGSIIPKIMMIESQSFLDAMTEAYKRFLDLEKHMMEAEEILERNCKIKR